MSETEPFVHMTSTAATAIVSHHTLLPECPSITPNNYISLQTRGCAKKKIPPDLSSRIRPDSKRQMLSRRDKREGGKKTEKLINVTPEKHSSSYSCWESLHKAQEHPSHLISFIRTPGEMSAQITGRRHTTAGIKGQPACGCVYCFSGKRFRKLRPGCLCCRRMSSPRFS